MNVKIKIKTTQKEYKGKSIFEHAADELMIQETFDPFDGGDVIETSLYGDISMKGNTYSLKYEELAVFWAVNSTDTWKPSVTICI